MRRDSAVVGGGPDEAASESAAIPELPRGGREILPRNRVVAYYGAPQDPELGRAGHGAAERVRPPARDPRT